MLQSYLYFCLQFDFTLAKLLKKRGIFVVLNKLCVFYVCYNAANYKIQARC